VYKSDARKHCSVPQHQEKGGVQLGREARSRAFMNALGSTEIFSATPPKSAPGAENSAGNKISDAIRGLKG